MAVQSQVRALAHWIDAPGRSATAGFSGKDVVLVRVASRSASARLDVLDEREEPLPLQWKAKLGEGCSLDPEREIVLVILVAVIRQQGSAVADD